MAGKPRLLNRPVPAVYKPHIVPASVGGINALDGYMQMPPQDCIYCWNITPSELGLRIRKGYVEHATGIGGAINSMVPFEGQADASANDRLFAVTSAGIYDVTTAGTSSPALEVTFSITTAGAGFGESVQVVTDADVGILHYADSLNGLHQYSEATGLWTVPAITGATPADIAFVTAWKNRLWYVESNSANAWYLAPDSIAGAATKFTFGSKFVHGGYLVGLWAWTIDGGAGIDDFLVAISSGGDVLVYQGTDPTTDFSLVGSWFIGKLPSSRRGVVDWGGDLYIMSSLGIVSLRDLLRGVMAEAAVGPSSKISRPLRDLIQSDMTSQVWALKINPSDGFLQIITPYTQTKSAIQYVQNLNTQAWGGWKTVPVNSSVAWNANYFFGDKEGSVWEYEGALDGTTLAGVEGQPISYDILTSFQAPEGDHTTHKRVGFIRPIGIASGGVTVATKAVYDYQTAVSVNPPSGEPAITDSLWDVDLWDSATWDFPGLGASITLGADGIGRVFAVSMKGEATVRVTLMAWDTTYTSGGFL